MILTPIFVPSEKICVMYPEVKSRAQDEVGVVAIHNGSQDCYEAEGRIVLDGHTDNRRRRTRGHLNPLLFVARISFRFSLFYFCFFFVDDVSVHHRSDSSRQTDDEGGGGDRSRGAVRFLGCRG